MYMVIVSVLMQGCSENNTVNDKVISIEEVEEITPLNIDSFSSPESVEINDQASIEVRVSGVKPDALVKYRFLPDANGIHFKPNSGIIAKNEELGVLQTQYQAPSTPGLYRYTAEFYGIDDKVTQQEFTIEVTN